MTARKSTPPTIKDLALHVERRIGSALKVGDTVELQVRRVSSGDVAFGFIATSDGHKNGKIWTALELAVASILEVKE